MKKQIAPSVKAYLIRGAFYVLVLLAFCVIPFALAQQNSDTRVNAHVHRPYRSPHATSGSVSEAWVIPYNGQAQAIAVDASGNVYVTGTRTFGQGHEYATIKYDSAGQEQWVAQYHGPGNDDYARAIALDDFGNVYVTGYSRRFELGDMDYATIKYSALGEQQWISRYNGPGNDIDSARALALDDSGNVYITGFSTGVGSAYDYATIKYNSAGQEQWVARYNGPGNTYDAPYAIAIDGSDNVYVTGSSGTDGNYTTIKYSSGGEQGWIARYSSGIAYAIALDGSNNVYVTGASSTIKYVQGPAPTPTATATSTPTATATATPTPTPRPKPTPRSRPTPPPRP